jgi:AraC family transcriptional activator of pobA
MLEFLFRTVRADGEAIAPHAHRCYELVYYGSGDGQTRIGDRHHSFRRGHYAIVRPSTVHDERRGSATDVVCAGFSARSLSSPLAEGVFADDGKHSLLPLLEAMLGEMQEQRPRYSDMLELLTKQLVITLERRHASEPLPVAEDKFRYTLGFMKEHFTQKIDFASLASMAGYSYDRYRHLFKLKTGCSPVQYQLRARLDYACSLLLHSDLSVAAIAMECGFSSDAQFCSLFKRELGETPKQHRARGARS